MSRPSSSSPTRRLLIAHPSPDLYGSDRQLLETVSGARESGWQVHVVLPGCGPLLAELRHRGAHCSITSSTVLRKSLLKPAGLAGLAAHTPGEIRRLAALISASGADAVLVNTVTLPWWPLAARLAQTPCLVHVHEAEASQPKLLRMGMNAPLLAANAVVTNSQAARQVLLDALPQLNHRTTVVHNGVLGPDQVLPLRSRTASDPLQLAFVGRLSPRKGPDVALEAIAQLREAGVDARLQICGSIFPGYEWFEEELRERAAQGDLRGAVEFLGYVHPTWSVLTNADVVLVPSRVEPFGNTAAEALLAGRAVIASNTQGLAEVIRAGQTGLLVSPGDASSLAAAIRQLAESPERAHQLAEAGLADAQERFTVQRYRQAMGAQLERLAS